MTNPLIFPTTALFTFFVCLASSKLLWAIGAVTWAAILFPGVVEQVGGAVSGVIGPEVFAVASTVTLTVMIAWPVGLFALGIYSTLRMSWSSVWERIGQDLKRNPDLALLVQEVADAQGGSLLRWQFDAVQDEMARRSVSTAAGVAP